jgi:putative ABC transport system substrate-binding protein
MRRRTFAFALGSLLLKTFDLAHGQQPRKIALIGYLSTGDVVSRGYRTEAFRQGLKDLGYIEGKNIIIEYRYAGARSDRLPELARELVGLKVDIIFVGGTPATKAAKNATLTIPIVTSSAEPVESGLVSGLAQPGGNITGLSNLTSELVGKRLELLKEMVPRLSHVAVLCTPGYDRRTWTKAELAAQSLGIELMAALVRNRDDLEPAFASIKRDRAGALITIRSPVIVHELRKQILNLAAKSRLPAIYDDRIFPQLGGLMSYGVNMANLDRRAAAYIDRILKGAKPANLPIEQPMKFDMVINLKTATALGLKIPAYLLMEADKVIE